MSGFNATMNQWEFTCFFFEEKIFSSLCTELQNCPFVFVEKVEVLILKKKQNFFSTRIMSGK